MHRNWCLRGTSWRSRPGAQLTWAFREGPHLTLSHAVLQRVTCLQPIAVLFSLMITTTCFKERGCVSHTSVPEKQTRVLLWRVHLWLPQSSPVSKGVSKCACECLCRELRNPHPERTPASPL